MIAGLDVVSPGEVEIDVGIENTANQPVRVENIRPFAISRSAPLDGTLFCDPAGSRYAEDPAPRILFDLDQAQPTPLRYTTAPMPPATMTVKPGGLVDVHVYGTSHRSDVRFRLALDVIADGKRAR